jgi:fermentation-respiration switch protein FrsA (DUF1100 family)
MTRINLQNTSTPETLSVEAVSFRSGDTTLRGLVFKPSSISQPLKAVVVTGAWTTVKEQMAGTYARELAQRGFLALVFDFSGWGQSDGYPRFVEDPVRKTENVKAASAYLASRDDVDTAAIHGLGVCASSGYIAAAGTGGEFASIALVAPWLHDDALASQIYGGQDATAALIATSEVAENQATGTVLRAASTVDNTAPMFQVPYYTEEDRGLIAEYDNKFSKLTWKPWLTYNALASAPELSVPLLMVGSDAMALPAGAEAYEKAMKQEPRKLWLTDINQFDFYDCADVVNQAADAVAAHFQG